MKHILNINVLFFLTICFVSCLKRDLPKATDSSLNNISDFNLLYKYADTIIDNPGTPQEDQRIVIASVQLNKTITISNDSVYVIPSLPAGFPTDQKAKVTLSHIWAYANIPDAATIQPLDNAPELGTPGNYSSPVAYEVTAANGNKKRWVISVAPLPPTN